MAQEEGRWAAILDQQRQAAAARKDAADQEEEARLRKLRRAGVFD